MSVYGVERVTSSPKYPQSNGFAERMVQTVENILQKCDKTREDSYLVLLSYRATPLDHQMKSPAELLTNRKFKTRLPLCHRAFLNSPDHEEVKTKIIPGNPSQTAKVLYYQIQQYRCQRSKKREPTQIRHTCSKCPTMETPVYQGQETPSPAHFAPGRHHRRTVQQPDRDLTLQPHRTTLQEEPQALLGIWD